MTHSKKYLIIAFIITLAVIVATAYFIVGTNSGEERVHGKRTTEEVIADLKSKIEPVYLKMIASSGFGQAPERITLLAVKDAKKLEMWFESSGQKKCVKIYDILAASGSAGPKLKSGDMQVPEGIYGIEYFNPNSKYYLSAKIDYPNEFDRSHAESDGRQDPGGDIFIHGKSASIGCLAMGDEAIEEIYYALAQAGKEKIKVIIMPTDFRKNPVPENTNPVWLAGLYSQIYTEAINYAN